MVQFRTDCSVIPIQQMGSDDMFVRAARRSTANQTLEGGDKLISWLMKMRHGTPFEHGSLTVEVEAPIFVAREWMRHRIGSYSELSGRYSKLEGVFWAPGGGRGIINAGTQARPRMEDGTYDQQSLTYQCFAATHIEVYERYQDMIEAGIAPEVARGILPVSVYTNFWFTANPRSIMNFLSLRVSSEDAKYPTYPQREIEQAAEALELIFASYWPITHRAFVEQGRVAP